LEAECEKLPPGASLDGALHLLEMDNHLANFNPRSARNFNYLTLRG
jgi:hypothetical protein